MKVGQTLWYYYDAAQAAPWAAIIAQVNADGTVNVLAANSQGTPFGATGVPVVEGADPALGHFCRVPT